MVDNVKLERPSWFPLNSYVPLDKGIMRDLEMACKVDSNVYSNIDELMQQIVKDTQKYINNFAEGYTWSIDEMYLNSNLKNLENLIKIKFDLDTYRSSLRTAKESIKEQMRQEAEYTEDELNTLMRENNGLNRPQNLVDFMNTSLNSSGQEDQYRRILRANEDYQFIKNVSFISKNPEDPIPDEDDDEELNVAGGKVSLKDPISLQFFRDPVCSNKCKHTFEKSSIEAQFSHGSSAQCPIDGCSKTITKNDLFPDKLMMIRVSIFKSAASKDKEGDESLERII
ncbi:zinc-finger of the MIZ type in Nse subunit-domain-containing protein [Scheffersomyces amazonensis]|uniref:zinc-finger of the MIZ type in Nse subunit-domain-containing protein n=1 Tax=Scheffersomyces amazonensis TaxID=1078765 RepID=UPI00315DFBF2